MPRDAVPSGGDGLSDEPGCSLSESENEVIPALFELFFFPQSNPEDSGRKSKWSCAGREAHPRHLLYADVCC